MHDRRPTWLWGGVGLVVSGLGATLAAGQFLGSSAPWLRIVTDVLYAATVIFLAIGLSTRSSVVARRPWGIASITVLGMWPIAEVLLVPLAGSGGSVAQFAFVMTFLDILVPLASALVAAAEIWRAQVLPPPWFRLPAFVLAGQTALWLLAQLSIAASGGDQTAGYLRLLGALGLVSVLAGTVGLGIVAIHLAARQRPGSVQVYP